MKITTEKSNTNDSYPNNLYEDLIIDNATNPKNFIYLDNYNFKMEGYNPLCGDKIILYLIIKDSIIINATFQGHGCAISTASASIMTELIIGKTIEYTKQLFIDFINNIIHNTATTKEQQLPMQLLALKNVKNYPARVKCATLPWHTLKSTLNEV